MAEEPKNVGNSPEPEPQGDPQAEPQPATPPVESDPYEGKTTEELRAILKEKESFIGKQTNEVGDLRNKMSEIENQIAFNQQFGQQQSPQQPNPLDTQYGNFEQPSQEPSFPSEDEAPSDFYDNPKKYFLQWKKEDDERKQAEWQKKDTEIRGHIFKAKPFLEQAKKESPNLFSGLTEQDMETALYNGLANKLVSPYALGDTKTYKQAAMWIQGEKTNYNFNPASTAPTPVQPTATEGYAGNKPQTEPPEPVNFGMGAKVMIQGMGKEMTKLGLDAPAEEEVAELVREERKDKRRRES